MFDWNINDNYNSEIIDAENKALKLYNDNIHNIVIPKIIINEFKQKTDKIECNVDNIIEINYLVCNPLEIISMQNKIIMYLLNYYKIYKLENINIYIKFLSWISLTSEYLCNLIKQPIKKNKTNLLMRSSYKFCNKNCDCQSQYGFLFNKKTRNCINDHYVHNKIISDIDNLLNYLKNNNEISLDIELRKGIETINYVINHMYQELSSFMLYLNNNKTKYNIYDFYKYYKKR
jgi:hypothetical protein